VDPTEQLTIGFVGALADLGLAHVAISPGSRNTPLSLAFLNEPRIQAHTVLDERSGGFFALGAAKASWMPAAVVSTSGTAAANYHPAVIEADASRTPLLVLTADRPPELRGTGANQTIDQTKLYGDAVRLFHDVGVPDAEVAAGARSLAIRAWAAAADVPAGPVHLNFPFREPFPTPSTPAEPAGARHVPGYRTLPPEAIARLADHLSGRRALIVAGGPHRPGFAPATAMLATEAGIPVLADVQCRFPSPATIAYPDLLVGAGVTDRLGPEVVLRVGSPPVSKAIVTWLGSTGAEQLYLDDGAWREHLGTAETVFRADPASTMADLAGHVAGVPGDWLDAWRSADEAVLEAFHATLADETFPNEPVVARAAWQAAPAGSFIYAGSSMPIRDLDSFAGPPRGDLTVLANRGASGIDGVLSAAAGAASQGQRVVALVGDISALHDANALELIGRETLPVTIVVVNNDGGGIFSFLPQADAVEGSRFDAAFATPHGRSLTEVAAAFGVPGHPMSSPAQLEEVMAEPGPALVEVRTDRTENVAVHRRLRLAAEQAVNALP
jgi:2-succinyl-5-enolpyruvyl-6-hydroxy-3-cyclohexene-1-carboxylate synthase